MIVISVIVVCEWGKGTVFFIFENLILVFMMINLVKTTAESVDFQRLSRALDIDLRQRDGDDHAFFAQFNKIDMLQYVLVAYNEAGEAVACGALKPYLDLANTMEVKRMYVEPQHRGKGISKAVLQSLESWAAALGYSHLVLETGWKMPEAIALYRGQGYEEIENYGPYVGVALSVCFEKWVG